MYANGLADRGNVGIVEAAIEGYPTMPGGAEGHALRAIRRVWPLAVVSGDQARDVDEYAMRRRLAGERMDTRTHDFFGALLLSAIRFNNSCHDFTNARAPSCCKLVASRSIS